MPTDSSRIPNTPVARRARIVELLSTHSVKSQAQLEALLHGDGLDVTQATVSRDLDELGAVKVRDDQGNLAYAVPNSDAAAFGIAPGDTSENRLARLCEELLVSIEAAGNFAVIHTPIGAAQFFASALDHTSTAHVMGTVAGDDTILVVCRSEQGAREFAATLKSTAEGHGRK